MDTERRPETGGTSVGPKGENVTYKTMKIGKTIVAYDHNDGIYQLTLDVPTNNRLHSQN